LTPNPFAAPRIDGAGLKQEERRELRRDVGVHGFGLRNLVDACVTE
jgi:hypothetical protein